jgi:TadE-like protein
VAKPSRRTPEDAQATVEFALILPLLVTVMWLGVESVLLVRDQTLVTHAAREAARAAAVGSSSEEAAQTGLRRSGLANAGGVEIAVSVHDEVAEVTVRLKEGSRLPLIGRFMPSLAVTSTLAMRFEIRG